MQKKSSAMRPSVCRSWKHSRSGALASAFLRRSSLNTGDSCRLRRLLIEMASSSAEKMKGIRQPQALKSASLRKDCSKTICSVDAIMPSGPISCRTLV